MTSSAGSEEARVHVPPRAWARKCGILTPYRKRYSSPPERKQSKQDKMTPLILVSPQSLHIGHGMLLVSKEGAELVKRRLKEVSIPVCCCLPSVVKWTTVRSLTYIPVILQKCSQQSTNMTLIFLITESV